MQFSTDCGQSRVWHEPLLSALAPSLLPGLRGVVRSLGCSSGIAATQPVPVPDWEPFLSCHLLIGSGGRSRLQALATLRMETPISAEE